MSLPDPARDCSVASASAVAQLPRRPWQVLIAEDDPLIAAVYRRTIATTPELVVAGAVGRGEDAIAFVQHRDCDLLLLDLRLEGMSGLRALRHIRASGSDIEVIALTATRNRSAVREVIRHGAVDYLVKPFTVERLRRALALFVNRASALEQELLDQRAVDIACGGGRVVPGWLPKGLTAEGLERVRTTLARSPLPQSAAEIATACGLARVTARRYLEYLVSIDGATVEAPPAGPGRPRKLYRSAPGLVPVTRSRAVRGSSMANVNIAHGRGGRVSNVLRVRASEVSVAHPGQKPIGDCVSHTVTDGA